MNHSESKYFATAARMDEAFLELLEKKDFAYITVKEICKKAGVNRSTFYLHYETVSDLLTESTQYLIDQLLRTMPYDTVEFLNKLPDRPIEELYLITPEYLTPYLTYIKEHRRVFRVSLEQASVLKMEDALYSGRLPFQEGRLRAYLSLSRLNLSQQRAVDSPLRISASFCMRDLRGRACLRSFSQLYSR